MGLIGSLDELGLVDVLQMLALAQKTGSLRLRSEAMSGVIEVRDGAVCGAALGGGPRELRSLLVGGGFVGAASFDAAVVEAGSGVHGPAELLAKFGGPSLEETERIARQAVEAAVFEMLAWTRGEFCFELEAAAEPEASVGLLQTGLSVQFLLMEAARCADEGHPGMPKGVSGAGQEGPARAAAPARSGSRPRPVIAIDADLARLAWVKGALGSQCERVHGFQNSELGLARIRQYLSRGRDPLVLLSPAMPVNRLTGFADAVDFVCRLQAQAPRLRVIWLLDDSERVLPSRCAGDGSIVLPRTGDLTLEIGEARAGALRELVSEVVADQGAAVPDRRVEVSSTRWAPEPLDAATG